MKIDANGWNVICLILTFKGGNSNKEMFSADNAVMQNKAYLINKQSLLNVYLKYSAPCEYLL